MSEKITSLPDLNRVFKNFQLLESWEERYKYIIQLGAKLPPMDEAYKTEENRVRGCSSQVWMVSSPDNSSKSELNFLADSDAHIVRGLIALLMIVYNHQTPRDVIQTDIRPIFSKLGLENHLSPTRTNGFYSMVEKIRLLAIQLTQEANS